MMPDKPGDNYYWDIPNQAWQPNPPRLRGSKGCYSCIVGGGQVCHAMNNCGYYWRLTHPIALVVKDNKPKIFQRRLVL